MTGLEDMHLGNANADDQADLAEPSIDDLVNWDPSTDGLFHSDLSVEDLFSCDPFLNESSQWARDLRASSQSADALTPGWSTEQQSSLILTPSENSSQAADSSAQATGRHQQNYASFFRDANTTADLVSHSTLPYGSVFPENAVGAALPPESEQSSHVQFGHTWARNTAQASQPYHKFYLNERDPALTPLSPGPILEHGLTSSNVVHSSAPIIGKYHSDSNIQID